jgi:hypothetical protein
MQQRVELLAVAGGEGGVEGAGEAGRGDFFHPDDPPRGFAVLAAERENLLEAAKRWCYN